MSGHTPGPWEIRYAANGCPYTITTTASGNFDKMPGRVGSQILRWGSFMLPSSAEARANARLIAAAPELLEALEQIAAPAMVPLDQLPDADQPNGWRDVAVERIELARAVLAKVRGAA